MADYSKDLYDYKYECRKNCSAFDDVYNQALEDFEAYAQKWADRQECIGRKVVKLVVNELIDSAKELKK